MENTTPIAVPPVAMFVPSMATTVDPTVAPTVETALPNPCRDIVLYQSEVGGSAHPPSPESTPSPPSPPVSQKPRTSLGKAPHLSKKVRPSLSSPSPPVSKRVTHSSSSHQSPSKPVGPPRPPSKVSIPTPTSDRVQTKRKSSSDTNLSAPHPILVREFYANLDRTVIAEGHPGCVSAFVRGHRVPFSPSTIASLLKVESIRIPTYGKHFNPDQTLMGRVLTGRDDYIWEKQEILVTHLTPFYRVLHRVALYNWFPNSHLSAVTLEIGKFLYAVGTNVSIDLPSLIFERILEASETTGTRNKLPFPSLVQRVLMDAHPPLTTHDYQVQNPVLSKSFLSVVNRKPSSTTPSGTKVSKGKSPMFKELSDSNWQVQMFSEFQSFAKRYKKDQKRQLAFEASMYQMVRSIKSTLLHHFPGDSLPDISLPEFHRDSFGASSDTSKSNAHMQGEPSAFDPVTSSAPPDLNPPADSATPLVSTGPPSQGESGTEQDPTAHIQ
ncbi:hypothetical protein CsatB_008088 [Cannabis sativa]